MHRTRSFRNSFQIISTFRMIRGHVVNSVAHHILARLKMMFSGPYHKIFPNNDPNLEHICTFFRARNFSYSSSKITNAAPLTACSIWGKRVQVIGIDCIKKVGYYKSFPGHRFCWFAYNEGDYSSKTHC